MELSRVGVHHTELSDFLQNSLRSWNQSRAKNSSPDREMNLADLLVGTMEHLGIRSAFGIPGGPITSLFNALSSSSVIHTTVCQHETGAAYMALGRTLVSRGEEMSVCFATAGPGITNMITGIAAANEERVPLLAITGNISTHLIGRYAAQDSFSTGIDACKMLESVSLRSVSAQSPAQAVELIYELIELSWKHRRPVHLNLPADIANTPIRDNFSLSNIVKKPSAQPSTKNHLEFRTAAKVLLESTRPLIFAGHGIKTSGLQQELILTLESCGLPLIVTSHAKGVIPEDHPNYFGTFGFAATERATQFLNAYDPTAIAFLGTRLGEPSSAGWSPLLSKPEVRIHVDQDPTQMNKVYPVTHGLVGNIRDFLEALASQNQESQSAYSENHWKRQLEVISASHQAFISQPLILPDDFPADPAALMELLSFWIPDDAIIFSDIGNSMAWFIHHYQITEGQEFYVPLGFGSMGSGLCGAVGAKSAHPHRPVFCIVGDASMLMHGTELFTSMISKWGVKILVLNDGGHGMVDHGNRLIGLSEGNVRFPQKVDFVKFGQALGLEGYSAKSLREFVDLPLEEIFRSPSTSIIDIHVDATKVPPIRSRARVLGQGDILRKENL